MGYIASMDKPQKTKGTELQELTQMQLAFCEYLVMNEGRTTNKDAALHAGYSPKRAAQEAYDLKCSVVSRGGRGRIPDVVHIGRSPQDFQ